MKQLCQRCREEGERIEEEKGQEESEKLNEDITQEEVNKAMNKLKNEKAAGIDRIIGEVLKKRGTGAEISSVEDVL